MCWLDELGAGRAGAGSAADGAAVRRSGQACVAAGDGGLLPVF